MANDFKLKTKANVGVTTENVYVVPSTPNTTTTVIGITLCNTSGSGIIKDIDSWLDQREFIESGNRKVNVIERDETPKNIY